ncbi:MAG TPA: hypothetical protein VGR55_13670, partial [Candidatus Acidoferrum sp.]|nr:hypothetical protein [Candidatus Acidoferrum sp.]
MQKKQLFLGRFRRLSNLLRLQRRETGQERVKKLGLRDVVLSVCQNRAPRFFLLACGSIRPPTSPGNSFRVQR